MIVRLLSIAAVLAVATAGVFGWLWWQSAHDADAQFAQARDEVLVAGERQIVDLNTVDYHDFDAAFLRWQSAATGPLLDRLTRNRETDRTTAQAAKTVALARIVGAAVTNLNTHSGSATVIAAVEVSVSKDGAPAAKDVSRLDVDLARTDAGWKVSGLEVVGS